MRWIAVFLVLFHGLNGLAMALWPDLWFSHVPGVTATGPFNMHFVRDTGLGFLSVAAALALFAATGERLLIWPALVFIGGHASLHLADMVMAGVVTTDVMRDFIAIVVPGLLPLIFLFGRKRVAVPA